MTMATRDGDFCSQSLFREEFKEFTEICTLIDNLPNIYKDSIAVEMTMERFLFVMDQYQEQPHLLDPFLETLLNKLLTIARNSDTSSEVQYLTFRMLYLITKTRGYKIVVRLLPHEVADVEPVLKMLAAQTPKEFATWETRYMLLLWLAMVCMIPFDLKRLDSNIKLDTGEMRTPVMDRIIEVGKCYLCVVDKCCDAAAYMLSRFLTRPDMKKEKLPEVLDWALQSVAGADVQCQTGVVATFGILRMLAQLFKTGKREDLVDYGPAVLQRCRELELGKSKSTLLRKLNMKLAQRLGLIFLKARVAAWRYQRGNRSLAENLSSQSSMQSTGGNLTESKEDEEYDIPEELEEIIELLLHGLRDKDTVVRWSAAKGVGRVMGRLPQELADEVVESIMALFTITETDAAWHGGCLALAELGRRGLLLPRRLSEVVPVIIKALSFDEKRGNFSVGSHVRDAACYVCWAFARAYDPQELQPHVQEIACALVITSVFDREVTVRRAAAAAFQENVGRQGTFPHGIDILTTCDYFAVGIRRHCYEELSVFVAQFDEYTIPLIDHLITNKLSHWDSSMRELASTALQNLVCKAPDYMAKTVLPQLLEMCTSIDLFTRHGAVLGVAEVTFGLGQYAKHFNMPFKDILSELTMDGLTNLISKLSAAQMFRGLGGELMRQAVCVLIRELSHTEITLDSENITQWQFLIDDCLQHIEPTVQSAAVDCIPAFMTQYYCRDDGKADSEIQDKVIAFYLNQLDDRVETVRQGFVQAIGALPRFMLHGKLEKTLEGIIKASTITSPQNAKFAMARSHAMKSLARLCVAVGIDKDGSSNCVLCTENMQLVYKALFSAMKDYTLDSRGDVGAGVREASMSSMRDIILLSVADKSDLANPYIKDVFCHLVQQASEKIDRTRAHSGEIFAQLLYHKSGIPNIPHVEELKTIFPRDEMSQINWAAASDTFPRFVKLLDLPGYRRHVLLGITVSVGGLTESLVKHSTFSLLHHLRQKRKDKQEMIVFTKTLLEIFEEYQKVDRVSLCMFKMLDQLLADDCFSCLVDDESLDLPVQLLNLSKKEIARCGEVQKLLASIDVFCGLLQFKGPVLKQAIFQLMVLLGHKFPIVRKTTSSHLYGSMITFDDLVEDDKLEDTMSLLRDTEWDHDLTDVRPIRDKICDMFEVGRPVTKKKT